VGARGGVRRRRPGPCGRGGGGGPSGATNVLRGKGQNGGAGGVEGRQILESEEQSIRQQPRVPGKEVGNGREPAAR
jgi:hypothetical protein